jgi:hypothetical protein
MHVEVLLEVSQNRGDARQHPPTGSHFGLALVEARPCKRRQIRRAWLGLGRGGARRMFLQDNLLVGFAGIFAAIVAGGRP